LSADGVAARVCVYDADRCVLSTDAGAAAATDAAATSPLSAVSPSSPVSAVSSSSTAFIRSSRQLRRFDSLPAYDVTGHVILSSARLVEKLTATLNALSIDCRQPGARNHGNDVAVTPELYDVSSAASPSDSAAARTRNPATNNCNNGAKMEIRNTVVSDPERLVDICQNVIRSSQLEERLNVKVESVKRLESYEPLSDTIVAESLTDATPSRPTSRQHQQQYSGDKQCSDRGDLEVIMDVVLDKGPLGLGFCIDGGLDAPAGPAPITVKRLFKGRRGPLKLNQA